MPKVGTYRKGPKPKKPLGEVFVIENRCKGCAMCIWVCPTEVLDVSPKMNAKGYHPPEVVNPQWCTGCKLCEYICPDFAIYVVQLKKKAKNEG